MLDVQHAEVGLASLGTFAQSPVGGEALLFRVACEFNRRVREGLASLRGIAGGEHGKGTIEFFSIEAGCDRANRESGEEASEISLTPTVDDKEVASFAFFKLRGERLRDFAA